MRWIVISLFLLNLGYFAWEYSQTKPAPPVTGVSASLPPLPGKRLVLLTERLPAADSAVPPPAPPRSSPVPEPRPENVDSVAGRKAVMCLSVGPYETAEQGNNLVASLAREGVEADLEQLELAQDSQYWVVLPPAASRKDALENLRKLQAKKIDSYLMAAGEMKNAISLGLFNKEASARGVLARVLWPDRRTVCFFVCKCACALGAEPRSLRRFVTPSAMSSAAC